MDKLTFTKQHNSDGIYWVKSGNTVIGKVGRFGNYWSAKPSTDNVWWSKCLAFDTRAEAANALAEFIRTGNLELIYA